MRPLRDFLLILCLLFAPAAHALNIDAPLPNAQAEMRAKSLMREIRCVVCQSESIADSPAEVARDMRLFIREDIASGASDDEIKANLVVRYGEAVLMEPPLTAGTILLWGGPWIVLLLASALAFFYFRSASKQAKS